MSEQSTEEAIRELIASARELQRLVSNFGVQLRLSPRFALEDAQVTPILKELADSIATPAMLTYLQWLAAEGKLAEKPNLP